MDVLGQQKCPVYHEGIPLNIARVYTSNALYLTLYMYSPWSQTQPLVPIPDTGIPYLHACKIERQKSECGEGLGRNITCPWTEVDGGSCVDGEGSCVDIGWCGVMCGHRLMWGHAGTYMYVNCYRSIVIGTNTCIYIDCIRGYMYEYIHMHKYTQYRCSCI